MKIFLFFLLLSFSINAQTWKSIITTSINVSNVDYIENHADKDGIHVVTSDFNDDIKYYLISTTGSTIRSTTISTNGEYPNIVGDETGIYVVYREGSNIRVKKTTNAGASWTDRANQSIGTESCSGVDAAINYYGIHTVWSIGASGEDYMETNYKRFVDGSNGWFDFKNVTDYTNGYGKTPSVSLSPDRVHVGYNSGYTAQEMIRTKYNSTWLTQQQAASYSGIGKIFAASNKLYDFYYLPVSGGGQYHQDLYYKYRNYGSTSWSSSKLLEGFADMSVPLVICETADGKIHTYTASGVVTERIIINGAINSTTNISSSGYIYGYGVSSVYNDIFVNWCIGTSNYLQFRHFDSAPDKPANFTATFTSTNPVISWSLCDSPDIQNYKIYKQIVNETGWACVATVSATTNSWIDYSVTQPEKNDPIYTIEYKMLAIDKGNNYSAYTNTQSVTGTTNTFWKISNNMEENLSIDNYQLFNNYPNPFNPSTIIEFHIPDNSFVNLTIYNSLGEKIEELVNSYLGKGKYSTEFNASNLPSGVYIYQIKAGNFISSKKMLLTK